MKQAACYFVFIIFFFNTDFSTERRDIIIKRDRNGGTKISMYTGGDYIELLVLKPEGVKLAGSYLDRFCQSPAEQPKRDGRIY